MSLGSRLSSLLRTAARSPAVRRAARDLGRSAVRSVQEVRSGRSGHSVQEDGPGRSSRSPGGSPAQARPDQQVAPGASSALADRASTPPVTMTYAPRDDDHPDPGEVVWAWVPYEEDLSRGKDRPVLVLAEEDARTGGRDGDGEVLIGLMLTTRDRAETGEVHVDQHGATWVDVGAGAWDSKGRPSEARADRLLRLGPAAVRREGAHLPRDRFDRAVAAVREVHGWDG